MTHSQMPGTQASNSRSLNPITLTLKYRWAKNLPSILQDENRQSNAAGNGNAADLAADAEIEPAFCGGSMPGGDLILAVAQYRNGTWDHAAVELYQL
jgi:hypothetical protein